MEPIIKLNYKDCGLSSSFEIKLNYFDSLQNFIVITEKFISEQTINSSPSVNLYKYLLYEIKSYQETIIFFEDEMKFNILQSAKNYILTKLEKLEIKNPDNLKIISDKDFEPCNWEDSSKLINELSFEDNILLCFLFIKEHLPKKQTSSNKARTGIVVLYYYYLLVLLCFLNSEEKKKNLQIHK